MNLSNGKISLIATLITITALCFFALLAVRQSGHVKQLYAQSLHTQNILLRSNEIKTTASSYRDVLTLYQITNNTQHQKTLDSLVASLKQSEQRLVALNVNNAQEKSIIDSLINFISAFTNVYDANKANKVIATELLPVTHSIIQTASKLEANSTRQLEQFDLESDNQTSYLKPILYLLTTLLLLLIIVLLQQGLTFIKTEKKAEAEITYNDVLAEQIEDAIIATDKTLNITRWNKKAEQLFGWKAPEIKGKPITQALKFDVEQGKGALILRKIIEDGIWEGELTILKKSGELVTLQACSTLLSRGDNKMAGTLTVIKDISEKKETGGSAGNYEADVGKIVEDRTSEIRLVLERLVASEKKYKLLFDYSPLPMWMISIPALQTIDVNDAAVKQFGYTRRTLLQMNVSQIIMPADEAAFKNTLQTASKGYRQIGTWRQRTKEGKTIYADLFTYNILLDGEPMCLVLSNDITHKIEAEEKIKQSLEAIRMLSSHLQNIREEERKNISRNIHDELGQHLTVIKMDVSWLNRRLQAQGEEITGRLKKMIETIDITIKFVRSLCSELRPSVLDDMGLIAALEWHAKKFEANTGVQVLLSTPYEPLTVTDESQTALFRIFQEALTNVARYANAQKVITKLTLNSDVTEMWITDDGIGFEPEAIERTQTLGILGMRERCIMLGGSFDIKSKPGSGTTVYASIPTIEKNIDDILLINETKKV